MEATLADSKYLGRPLRIALIEPNEPDARWFQMIIPEIPMHVATTCYPTGIAALEVWARPGKAAPIDLIVMPDVLPMLTTQEFVDRAKPLYPDAAFVIAGECLRHDELRLVSPIPAGIPVLTKPLSPEDITCLLTGMLTKSSVAHCRAA
jgi:hypothetical protein